MQRPSHERVRAAMSLKRTPRINPITAVAFVFAVAVASSCLVAGHAATIAAAATTEQRFEFGQTSQGRSLSVLGRGEDDATVDVLIVGAIHGNERAGVAIVRRLQDVAVPAGVRIWLVATINRDGTRVNTRQNARGVDLNRNFPIGWTRCCRRWDTYFPGPSHSSEPETRAAKALVHRVRPDVTIWYHQHLNLVDRPSGAFRVRLARRYATVAGMRLRQLAPLPGTATRWQNRVQPANAAFVVELPAGALNGAAVRRHVAAIWATAAARAAA